jgi:3',5'-cyclic AMP phosphodiesterase CpdA
MRTAFVLFLGFSACLLLAQPATEPKVIGGPYVVHAGQRSATVVWVVQSGQLTVTAPGQPPKTIPVLHSEKAVLNGLRPNTLYQYESFGGEAGKGSFKTAPAGPTPFQFVVYGDVRTRHEVHRTVIQGILKHATPDFIIHTGDLVENGDDTSLWPIFFDIERDLLRKTPIFPSPGNHERNSPNYFNFMDTKAHYSFDWGSAHFASIDSDIANVAATQPERDAFWKEQTEWLENDLKQAQTAGLRFVFAHHPPMTAVAHRQGDNPHMTALEPMFEKYKVTAGLFGHDHNYQHYLQRGIHYYVSGGGGAPLYDVDKPPAGVTVKVESTENFIVVNVNGNKARIEAFRPNGTSIDVAEVGQ